MEGWGVQFLWENGESSSIGGWGVQSLWEGRKSLESL